MGMAAFTLKIKEQETFLFLSLFSMQEIWNGSSGLSFKRLRKLKLQNLLVGDFHDFTSH